MDKPNAHYTLTEGKNQAVFSLACCLGLSRKLRILLIISVSCWRPPAATSWAAIVRDLGVVLLFWKLPVSPVMPVSKQVAISESIRLGVSLPRVSKRDTKISAVEEAVISTIFTLPKLVLAGWWS